MYARSFFHHREVGTKEIGILKADTEAHAKGFSGDKNVEGKHKREKKTFHN